MSRLIVKMYRGKAKCVRQISRSIRKLVHCGPDFHVGRLRFDNDAGGLRFDNDAGGLSRSGNCFSRIGISATALLRADRVNVLCEQLLVKVFLR